MPAPVVDDTSKIPALGFGGGDEIDLVAHHDQIAWP